MKQSKDILWNLFKKTGDIKYYNLMKQIKKKNKEKEEQNAEEDFKH